MKAQRQKKILEIIEKYEINTQESLIEKLREAGFEVTQTTVSRDIRQLNLVKGTAGNGTFKYISPGMKNGKDAPVFNSSITDSVTSIDSAQNIAVIKTLPGMANAVAVCVDSVDLIGLVGTVAGDDTILLVLKDNTRTDEAVASLKKIFGV